jgi:hypothetical protein
MKQTQYYKPNPLLRTKTSTMNQTQYQEPNPVLQTKPNTRNQTQGAIMPGRHSEARVTLSSQT